jgi:hypothetical protein
MPLLPNSAFMAGYKGNCRVCIPLMLPNNLGGWYTCQCDFYTAVCKSANNNSCGLLQKKIRYHSSSSYFTAGPVGFPTVVTAAYRLILTPCFGAHFSPRETPGRKRENYRREMAE